MQSTADTDTVAKYEYVGFWSRLGASLIDSVLIMAITLPLLHVVYGRDYLAAGAFDMGALDFIISYIFPLVATILFWIYKSATPGKMVLKLKVVDAKTGQAPSIQQSIIRYVGYYISLLPLCLGFIWIAWDAKKQGWHDKLAGTVVIQPVNKGVEPVSFVKP
ncbi:RDD family protein [Alteromonas sp. MMG017]|uniref:RDD family protein n=1 Tax=Alteromonas sp. MMG017 TaxID=2822692 RepID=UPI001B3A2238|nr:RDD family protein [Alteromonas sp. MMG017]MBQ4829794.1 RDD family protein [Alteromonas sp. MMG017]